MSLKFVLVALLATLLLVLLGLPLSVAQDSTSSSSTDTASASSTTTTSSDASSTSSSSAAASTTTSSSAGSSNMNTASDCYNNFTVNVDYFPAKANLIDDRTGFSVSYHNYFKIVTNTFANETYCLYCTQTIPSRSAIGVPEQVIVKYFRIPVDTIYIKQHIPSLNYLELLGSLGSVKAVSPLSNVTSTCALDLISTGNITDAANSTSPVAPAAVVFTPGPSSDDRSVAVSLDDNLTPLAKANWIQFYSTFTNQEQEAELIFKSIRSEYNCNRQNLFNITNRNEIAWVSYDPATSTWNLRNDTFRSSLIRDAAGSVVPTANQTSFTDITAFRQAIDGAWMVIDETPFVNDTYDAWLSLSGYGPAATANASFISKMRVYRTDRYTNKAGFSDWSERSSARPDLILKDIIAAQYPSYDTQYNQSFLENWSRGDHINVLVPDGMCNASPVPPNIYDNCTQRTFQPPAGIDPLPSSPHDDTTQPRTLSREEKFGIGFGVVGAAVLLVSTSLVVIRFMKRRRIGFGENTTGFVKMDDLD